MVKKKIEDVVEEICRPITDELELELIDVEYKKEGTDYILRAIIDKKNGVTIEDCEAVSRKLSDKLDELDPIENSYNLEVQSPGERILRRDREFEYYSGRNVEIKLYEAVDGKKTYEGKLLALEDGLVKIMLESGDIKKFARDKTAHTRLKIIF